ncbi:hypothetical protein OKW23_000846 [Bacilli bacterium PM5-9]|nr:hypothetical protein [Bacilli bacterium PM5-9]
MEEKRKKRFIVIGNGFDASLGIKSSYSDFMKYIINQKELRTNEEIYTYNKLFVQDYNGEQLNWCDFELMFENQMIELNEKNDSTNNKIQNIYQIKKLNEDIRKLEFTFLGYIKKEYEKWHHNIISGNKKVNKFYVDLFKEEENIFISFNYTNSLDSIDKIYKSQTHGELNKGLFTNDDLKNVFQVHGSLNDGNIVFGGGFSGDDIVDKICLPGTTDNDKLVRIKGDSSLASKRNEIMDLIEFEQKIDLYILGHSLIGSDFAFLKPMFEKAEKVFLFYFNDDYKSKMQFIIKTMGKKYAEKINLVPFFDILIDNMDEKKVLTIDDYNALYNVFKFPVPMYNNSVIDEFSNFELLPNSFVFNKIENFKIERKHDAKIILKTLSDIDIKNVKFNEDLSIILKNINELDILSNLFDNEVFKKALSLTRNLEISNCNISINKFINIIDKVNQIENLKLEKNIFELDKSEKIDLSYFSRLNIVDIVDNSLLSNDIEIENILLEFELTNPANEIIDINFSNNENIKLSKELYSRLPSAKNIILSVSEEIDRIILPKAEYVELLSNELNLSKPPVPTVDMMIFSDNIEYVSVTGVKIEKKKLSEIVSLNNNSKIFPSLKNIELNDVFDKCDFEVDIFCDIFKNDPYISIDGEKKAFRNIIEKNINNEKVSFEQEPKQNGSTSNEVTNTPKVTKNQLLLSKDLNDKSIKLIEEYSMLLAIDYDALFYFIKNYNFNSDDIQEGYAELKDSSSISEYNKKTKKELSKLEYYSLLKNECNNLAEKIKNEMENKNDK